GDPENINELKTKTAENTYEKQKELFIRRINDLSTTQLRSTARDLLDYIGLDKDFVADVNSVNLTKQDFTGFTLTEYKKAALKKLAGYEASANDSAFDNQQRFLALLYLACSDYVPNYSNTNDYSKWVKPNSYNDTTLFSLISGISKDEYTVGLIMRMAGLANRSESELVGQTFMQDLNIHTKSEENGDVFIITIRDGEKYIPFLMANNDYDLIKENADYVSFIKSLNLPMPYTSFYGYEENENSKMGVFMPIVAKGVITKDGKPTTIKEENGQIVFYRNDIRIVSTSKLGLSEYFQDSSQVMMQGSFINMIANTISRWTTGRSLSENIIDKIPRYAVNSKLHFAYGTKYSVADSVDSGRMYLDYNFLSQNGASIDNLYNPGKLNVVVLLLACIFLFKALWKLAWGLVSRILNITVYSMISPLAFATMALADETKDKKGNMVDNKSAYDRWFSSIKESLLSVLGFSIGLNVFFILVPIIRDFKLFSDALPFSGLPFGGIISGNMVNAIVQMILTICSVYVIDSAPKLFSGLLSISNIMENDTLSNVKNTLDQVADANSGRSMLRARDKAIGLIQNAVPGGMLLKNAKEKIASIKEKHEDKKADKLGKKQYINMIKNGATEEEARKAQRQITDAYRNLNKNQQTVKQHKQDSKSKQKKSYQLKKDK
ncbi:MAG: hypothetical protein IJT25_00135, partial [Clostridia bacterium]|nr:hypothetical protein [Clostridia bacterium]